MQDVCSWCGLNFITRNILDQLVMVRKNLDDVSRKNLDQHQSKNLANVVKK